MSRYQLSPTAIQDASRVYRQGAQLFGERQADRYYVGLTKTLDLLAKFPDMAPTRTAITPPVRVHAYQSHVIVYLMTDDGILVLRIRHSHEDWSANPLG